MPTPTKVSEAVSRFLTSFPKRLEFPAGGNLDIPCAEELDFAQALRECPPMSRADFGDTDDWLTMYDAYSLVVFAVRMSLHAARVGDPKVLVWCINGLVIDNDLLDWRDVLIALSIVEEFARRLGLDAPLVLDDIANRAAPERKSTIRDGYLTRTPQMRSGSVMRWKLIDQNGILTLIR